MFNLGYYYHRTGDYEEMTKYYLMSIHKNNIDVMINITICHKHKNA